MANDFEKPLTLGVNSPNGFFSEEGSSGYNLSTYDGRLSFKFWRKGEKSNDNRDNTLSLNINQVMVLNNMLKYVIMTRQTAYAAGGAEAYVDITDLHMNIDGVMNGQPTVFGVIRFDTVEIEGIKRLKLTVTRNTTVNTIVFCDKFLKNTLPANSPFRPQYDVMDSSFLRLCIDVNNFLNFAWMQGGFNKLFNAIVKPSKPAGNGGGYNRGGTNNGGGNSSYNGGTSARGGSLDRDYESPVFSSDDDEY